MKAFFKATKDAAMQVTALFDFTWSAVPALWNLRWQVAGFLKEVPQATEEVLRARFIVGSNVHGTNLRRTCITIDWAEQTELFASIVLTNVFSVYEHWASSLLAALGSKASGKALQWPDKAGRFGFVGTLKQLCKARSSVLSAAYYPVFTAEPKYSLSLAKNQLLCYRYFKEARNSQIHNGGLATQAAKNASDAFFPVSSKAALAMKGVLEVDRLVEGKRVRLPLRGVVGFCDVLLRLMQTADAELCRSAQAEKVFKKMLSDVRTDVTVLSANARKRGRQVVRRCWAAGLPTPADPETVYRYMLREQIIRI